MFLLITYNLFPISKNNSINMNILWTTHTKDYSHIKYLSYFYLILNCGTRVILLHLFYKINLDSTFHCNTTTENIKKGRFSCIKTTISIAGTKPFNMSSFGHKHCNSGIHYIFVWTDPRIYYIRTTRTIVTTTTKNTSLFWWNVQKWN